MKVFRGRFLLMAAVIVAAALAIGCASKPKVTSTDKIAVVNFTLEKSIVRQGDMPDNGPGLLNSKTEDYYKYHKESVAKAWDVFKDRASEILSMSVSSCRF